MSLIMRLTYRLPPFRSAKVKTMMKKKRKWKRNGHQLQSRARLNLTENGTCQRVTIPQVKDRHHLKVCRNNLKSLEFLFAHPEHLHKILIIVHCI